MGEPVILHRVISPNKPGDLTQYAPISQSQGLRRNYVTYCFSPVYLLMHCSGTLID
jgi:hypothetical protein